MRFGCTISLFSWRIPLLLASIIVLACSAAGSFSVGLPQAWENSTAALLSEGARTPSRFSVDGGYSAFADNNVISIWEFNRDNPAPRLLTSDPAFAKAGIADWMRLKAGAWWAGAGAGWIDHYQGNRDAAQLYLDIRADTRTRTLYQPYANNQTLNVRWYGFGRSFPVQVGAGRGEVELALRGLVAHQYVDRSVKGTVAGDDFSGIARVVSSDTPDGRVYGRGWCLDARAGLGYGLWRCRITAEGMAGGIRWHGLAVDDGYITSPSVFTDPDGFLRDVGGSISGTTWRTDRSVSISPALSIAAVRDSSPSLLLNLSLQPGERGVAGAGLAWPQRKQWAPYAMVYPSQRTFEIGVTGGCWRLRVAGDQWLWANPQQANIELSTYFLSF